MECLDKVIKLSRTQCECFADGQPLDYNEGKSNIYLDELEGLTLDLISSVSDCSTGSLWDLMSKARENATLQFKADLLSCIGTNYKPRRNNYKGLIGNTKFNATLNYTETMSGMVIRVPNIIGGYLTINRIGLMFNTTSSFNISIYSNEDITTPIAQYPVTSAANNLQYVDLTTPLKLKLWSDQISNLEYYVVYNLTGAYYPKNNKVDCGCSNKQLIAFKNWVQVSGLKANSLDQYQTTNELNGLALDVDLNCDTTRLICSDEYPLNFEGDGQALQIGYTIRFKAGEILIENILSSGEINRYTMIDRETLWGKRNRYRKLYEDWISYLCENMDVLNNNCLMCRPNPNISKGGIFA